MHAERAPSKLTRDAMTPGAKEEHTVYTPYDPVLPESAKVAGFEGFDEDAPPEVRQSPEYRARLAELEKSKLPGQNDFSTTIGDNRYSGQNQTAGQPAGFAAAPSLPPVKVALLLPLSGQHADLGQAMLQSAQLALFDMGYDAFELMPRDTRGTPQGAAQAAQSVVNDGAQLVLGPLFASEVSAAKPITSRYNINMIAFSTDWSLAGGNTYIMGFLPFAQVQRVAEYAITNGLDDIGILAPNTDYGNAVIAAYNSLTYRAGLGTADVARFIPDSSDNSGIIRSFTTYDERVQALEELKMPLQARLEQNPDDKKAGRELDKLEKMNTWGEAPFNAVLLPVGGDQARSVANMLSFYDLGPAEVKRLGTGLWDDRGLATEPALEGAWFAAPSPDLRRDFERRYRDLYGSRAPRLATLTYDATALAAVLAKSSYYQRGRPSFERQALVNPNGYSGIDGIFRFRPDGLIERGLAVLEFRGGNIRVIDPAPSTFQRMSY